MHSLLKNISKILMLSALLIHASACLQNQQKANIKISVVNDEGTPIANAQIFINDELQTNTNNNGEATIKKSFANNSKITLEVRKNSKLRYYAPFLTRVDISDSKNSQKSITATLYSVPKPAAQTSEVGVNPNIVERLENESTDLAEEPKEANQTPIDSVNTKPTPEDQTPVEESNPTIVEANPIEKSPKISEEDTTKAIEEETTDIAVEKPSLVSLKAIALGDEQENKEPRLKNEIINFYTFSNNKPVADTEIYIGFAQKGTLTLACTTNKNGHCIYKTSDLDNPVATILAQKKGYQTLDRNYRLKDGNRIRFNMKPGHTIDIFAIMKRYDQTRGVDGIKVFINGQKVGETDDFGRASYLYKGKPGDLVEVTLTSDTYIPKTYTTDYVIAGPTSLVRYYSPANIEPIKVALAPIQAAGRLGGKTLSNFGSETNKILSSAMRSRFFTHPAFQKADENVLRSLTDQTQQNLLDLLSKGWQGRDIQTDLDAVVLPTLILQNPLRIELSLLNSAGQVLTAAQEELVSFTDKNAINYSVESLEKKLIRKFPFEGTIIQKMEDTVWINFGKKHQLQIDVGDEFDIYGPQSDALGQKITHTFIGRIRINQVLKDKSRGQITKTLPRSLIDTGDQIVLKRKLEESTDQIAFTIIDVESKNPITQANIYFKNNWLGSTNDKGLLNIGKATIKGIGLLHIIKPGYQDFTKELTLSSLNQIEIPIERETAFVQLESEPENAKVYIDGTFVGETPFQRPVAVPTGFVKIQLIGPSGFKKYEKILDLSAGTLSLTGDRKVYLEVDLLAEAKKYLNAEDTKTGLEKLESITSDHSDYLLAQHLAGEIYLSTFKDPVKAATAFARVTKEPEVQGFNNKQFIISHVNEALALYMAANSLESESKEAAIAHYLKAIEIFSRVEPQLRYIAKQQHAEALHNTLYYKALAGHKVWNLSMDPAVLSMTHKNWLNYMNGPARNEFSKNSDTFLKNAETYLKQIEASINTAKMKVNEDAL